MLKSLTKILHKNSYIMLKNIFTYNLNKWRLYFFNFIIFTNFFLEKYVQKNNKYFKDDQS